MKKLLFLFLFCASFAISQTVAKQSVPLSNDACSASIPYGIPTLTAPIAHSKYICRAGYFLLSDLSAKIPVWVAYTLTPEHAIGCIPRSNAFEADQSLAFTDRANLKDYEKSGYDIGHMSNDGDNSYNITVEYDSFILTNMSPQMPSINRGSWKLLETTVRAWAHELNHPLTIYVGDLYDITIDKTIGDDKVVVPHNLYKIVIDDTTGEYAGWLFPNVGNPGNDLSKVRVPVAQFEQLSGVTYYFPAGAKELPLTSSWPVSFKKLLDDKKLQCSK